MQTRRGSGRRVLFSPALEEQWVWKETSLIGMNCFSDNLHFLYRKHHANQESRRKGECASLFYPTYSKPAS